MMMGRLAGAGVMVWARLPSLMVFSWARAREVRAAETRNSRRLGIEQLHHGDTEPRRQLFIFRLSPWLSGSVVNRSATLAGDFGRGVLVGAEAEEGGDVASLLELRIRGDIKDVHALGDSLTNDGVGDVLDFAHRLAADGAGFGDVRIHVAAVRALDGVGGKILAQQEGLDLAGFDGGEHAA